MRGQYICRVVMDFMYHRKNTPYKRAPRWDRVVEDVKRQRIGEDGKVKFTTDTRLSQIKRKLLNASYGIETEIVK